MDRWQLAPAAEWHPHRPVCVVMGKGSNVQKKEAARARAQKDKSKTPEERAKAAARAKADAEANACLICKQTFTLSQARGNPPKALLDHASLKHPGEPISKCFAILNDDGTKKVDDTHTKVKKKTNVKTTNKAKASGDLPPELMAAMAKTKVSKKKK